MAAPSIQYATAQKLFALPAYQQSVPAYKIAPTAPTAAAAQYTAAYVQPNQISPYKVNS